jgi:nicotinamidase-related amidase
MSTALVVIDVQAGMFNVADPPVYQGEQLLERIGSLISKARKASVPVIYVRHHSTQEGDFLKYGEPAWQVHPAIAPLPGEVIVDKTTPDSFYKTTLEQVLQEQGIKQLILTGIQSDFCVDTTCRSASSHDYDLILVKDAHSTWDLAGLNAQQIIDHENAVLRWFATLKSTDEVTFEH